MHNVLLSNINDALLEPHQNLYEMIPGIRSAHSQATDFDEEMIFPNEQGDFQHFSRFSENSYFSGCQDTSILKDSTYLISNGRILYRDGLLKGESSSDADCRMCHQCWLAVSKGKISKFSPANGILPDDDVPESIWATLDHILDDKNAHAEREGDTEDPLTSDQAMSEKATSDFIPLNPSGILDVNGASVSA
ncbi:unnamed protein product [Adineta steineri]|uniref:Uncharacterized protein n=1 Tax=Adineta steineri TaxID=433720 RepID=A0A819T5J5_9BILA|nr:unnamed protein product [Adineta steineri]CAF4061011.1 unnamed protein product [Adineta steineri]